MDDSEIQADIQRGALCATTSILHFLVAHMTISTPREKRQGLHNALLEFRQNGFADQDLGLGGEESFNHIYDMVEGAMTSIIDRRLEK